MQDWEIQDYIDNIKYLDVNSWEQTRLIMYVTAQVNSKKKLELKDVIKFPWDNSQNNTEIKSEDIIKLKEKAKLISEQLKTNNGKK